ncbi:MULTISPECIES: hypothetical protein [Halorussus]|uniref:hypothetical protein n=1 Tax=Halorussus TaxID=1070314 RepID=UPI000E20CF2C|nr:MULTISPECIES: hypothetical protein [Halorussus]NHN57905.1 hypothetical protein [Halorussus sp. JP-T4]
MGLKKSLLSGIVAFVVASIVARKVGGERLGTRVGLLTGSSVAVSTWLSGRGRATDVEFEDPIETE